MKRRGRGAPVAADASNSPALRGGLIEAQCHARSAVRALLPIPPPYAGASLKRVPSETMWAAYPPIPPPYAGASLKPFALRFRQPSMESNSPALRGGLIEAAKSRTIKAA